MVEGDDGHLISTTINGGCDRGAWCLAPRWLAGLAALEDRLVDPREAMWRDGLACAGGLAVW